MTPAARQWILPAVALLLVVVLMLQGCASAPKPAPESDQDRPRTQQASYAEPACQSLAAYSLIAGLGLPGYLIVSGFANRACSGVTR